MPPSTCGRNEEVITSRRQCTLCRPRITAGCLVEDGQKIRGASFTTDTERRVCKPTLMEELWGRNNQIKSHQFHSISSHFSAHVPLLHFVVFLTLILMVVAPQTTLAHSSNNNNHNELDGEGKAQPVHEPTPSLSSLRPPPS